MFLPSHPRPPSRRATSVCATLAGRGTSANEKLMNVYRSPAKTTPPAPTFSTATSRCASWLGWPASGRWRDSGGWKGRRGVHQWLHKRRGKKKEAVPGWQRVLPPAAEIMNCRWQVKQMSQSMAHSMKRFQGMRASLGKRKKRKKNPHARCLSASANAPPSRQGDVRPLQVDKSFGGGGCETGREVEWVGGARVLTATKWNVRSP